MFVLLINKVRDFLPQGSDAPVGLVRGMRWRLPGDWIDIYPGEDLI